MIGIDGVNVKMVRVWKIWLLLSAVTISGGDSTLSIGAMVTSVVFILDKKQTLGWFRYLQDLGSFHTMSCCG
ncbi:hypothetical protein HanRHA438_Chr17g0837761 [Helianthus annuus]|nr:hypothetical protein HanHA300_Chr17g0673821 [Helianthus annuus]KAJ0435903.1 hypothetical protein HanIR_Chr17g0898521 [Helianthus annuus]KAJ0449309.1 hypothetical protein HanHA89_Chr17g0726951 [Helianthus annuus]KAJ0637962.1 hypothetical protein HanOQP8_Chr17g0679911 [Helianthus annuus]KAJ0828489.1 hypothetical protein HanRHA438_Chr17g0837761 [Helianthus annuus]